MKRARLNHMMALPGIALALVLVGCGGGGGDEVADMTPIMTPMPPTPSPVDATGSISLTAEQHAALLEVLPDNRDTVKLDVDADGATRAGVTFTCMSAYPCTVNVTNSAGTIVATWASQTLGDGTASAMAMGLEPPVDTFAELNAGNTESIRADVAGAADDSGTVGPDSTPTELIGMGIGGPGVLNADKAGLRSDFQANGADLATPDTVAAPGAPPALMGGTTITGAMDAIDPSEDMASAPDGWVMKTLFRDWGDTAGDGDGGFETGAIVVKNLGEGTPYPFDRKLSGKYADDVAKTMFALTLRDDGTAPPTPGVPALATSVDINTAATPTQRDAMVFDSTSLVPAQDQDLTVDLGETFTGMYFDAPGQFRCLEPQTGTANCGLARNDDGTVGVADGDATTTGIQIGRWMFTPDPDAMITVPDQDWMAYGAWLTTPDNASGDHRLGVFFNGMDPWAATENATSLNAEHADGLRGSATYSGGATGVYVDGTASGLFTARAMLTADFDKGSDGADVDEVDYTISGRIDNFRGTDGVYLGDDTQASPNDPTAGENDWVVELGTIDFGTATDGVLPAPENADNTSGSADGVPWTGRWNGQFFGPSTVDGDPAAPSGVAGQFWAETEDPLTADTTGPVVEAASVGPVTAVFGAFGATRDD